MTWTDTTDKTIRIALLDDHPVVRHGLAARLMEEKDFKIVGMYETSKELMQSGVLQGVEVFVIDYALGENDIDGLNLLRALRMRFPGCKVLVSSAHDSPATVVLALRAGARGFVSKAQAMDELVGAIRVVVQGRVYLSEPMSAELSPMITGSSDSEGLGLSREIFRNGYDLSPREREVLRCCLDGMTVTQIATKFARSIKTISGQKQSAFRKMGIRNDGELFKIQQHLRNL